MDILKVLAYNNDRTIRETVVSSILNYLLSPTADHGFGSSFVAELLSSMKGVCTFIDDTLIKQVKSYALSEDFAISVSSEWMPPDRQAFLGRRLDSLLEIRHGRKAFLVGIEVKIYEDSAQDPTQLKDYAAMLAMHRDIVAESLNQEGIDFPESEVKVALVYLVPGSAEKAFEYALSAAQDCINNNIEGIVVLPWWMPEQLATLSSVIHASFPMDEIVKSVIKSYLYGTISPCDPHAIDLLRSLSNAIGQHFNFRLERGESRFLVGSDYESGLSPTSRSLLKEFREAAIEEGIKRPLVASPRHTSIGIPFASPPRGSNNTLCRIETIESYDTGKPRTTFVLELSRKKYEKSIEKIMNVFKDVPVKARKDDHLGQYHENGKQDEEVIRIYFEDREDEIQADERPRIRLAFRELIATLRKIFNELV